MQYTVQTVGNGIKKLVVITLASLMLVVATPASGEIQKSSEDQLILQMADGGPPMRQMADAGPPM